MIINVTDEMPQEPLSNQMHFLFQFKIQMPNSTWLPVIAGGF